MKIGVCKVWKYIEKGIGEKKVKNKTPVNDNMSDTV